LPHNDIERAYRVISKARRAPLGRAEERRLLAAARAGDERALARLLTLLMKPVYRFSAGFCRDPHDAEDVVQDVLVSLTRSLAGFRGDASLSTWAYTVARRACMRQRRRRVDAPDRLVSIERGGPGGEPPQLVAHPDHDPALRHERGELRAALEAAIASLPATLREVLVLRDVEGLSALEAGRVLRLGERAVKSRLHRARLRLREMLAPHVTAPPRGRPGPPAPAGARCPDSARLVSRYLEGDLSPAVCARLQRHVAGCRACGDACDSLRQVLSACRAWGAAPLPPEARENVRAAIRRVLAER
jgi:RNA polymerase sigma-70 factor (ECF subfamily)